MSEKFRKPDAPEPLLGLATTRQLLDEIRARMDGPGGHRGRTAGPVGSELVDAVRLQVWRDVVRASEYLPPDVLDYRTVD